MENDNDHTLKPENECYEVLSAQLSFRPKKLNRAYKWPEDIKVMTEQGSVS